MLEILTTNHSPLFSLGPDPTISERNSVHAEAEELTVNFAELPINLNEIIGQLASTKAEVNELNILLTTAIAE